MARWQQLKDLESVNGLYGSHFSVEVRESLADWLEQQPWDGCRNDASASQQLVHTLILKLEEAIAQLDANNASLGLKLQEATLHFTQQPPQQVVGLVADLFAQEQVLGEQQDQDALVSEMLALDDPLGFIGDDDAQRLGMDILSALGQELGPATETLNTKQEAFVVKYQQLCQFETMITQLTTMQVGTAILSHALSTPCHVLSTTLIILAYCDIV
eukprot:m.200392 g.200392  ORF g.200392 m.200392 type:complete len:215 (-) comp17053_c1_seq2:2217-2861(-)